MKLDDSPFEGGAGGDVSVASRTEPPSGTSSAQWLLPPSRGDSRVEGTVVEVYDLHSVVSALIFFRVIPIQKGYER